MLTAELRRIASAECRIARERGGADLRIFIVVAVTAAQEDSSRSQPSTHVTLLVAGETTKKLG